jgi:hypothetical protein
MFRRKFFSTPAFPILQLVLSLIGIGSDAVVILGLFKAKRLDGWTAIFLASTVATTVTGFLFPFHQFLPSCGVGVVSMIVLGPAIFARYSRHLADAWRRVYVVTASTALYLNVFVLIAHSFSKYRRSEPLRLRRRMPHS